MTLFKDFAVVLALAAASACSDPAANLPAPVFTRSAGLPGFVVECRNTTDRPMSRVDAIQALRLDGAVMASQGGIGSLLGGPPPDVAPGKTWNHVVVLHPDRITRTSSVGLEPGTLMKNWAVPLGKGRHTVAFQCAGEWTADVSFDW